MSDNSSSNPEDEFRELFEQFLSGKGDFDPAALAGAAGLPANPEALQALFAQLRAAMSNPTSAEAAAKLALEQAVTAAGIEERGVEHAERVALLQAFDVGDLWLSEVTDVGPLQLPPVLLTRREWVRLTMSVWRELSDPVASSISSTMSDLLETQTPDDMKDQLTGATSVLRSLGNTLFSMQLGHIVGQLSKEVLSGGDIGVALLPEGQAGLLPQNLAALTAGLDIAETEVALYVAVRELAHARLFHFARWLPLDVRSALTAYAQGIRVDAAPLENLLENFDPSQPDELQRALSDGRLIPPKTEDQERALRRIETQLALIEGWVDVVTEDATRRLPKASALAETIRRRRASGGPAESAFAALVGLELRPRRLREAAAMWRAITTAVGASVRDALWTHPDSMPDADAIDDPTAFVNRLTATARGDVPAPDEIDRALAQLLDEEEPGDSPGQNWPS